MGLVTDENSKGLSIAVLTVSDTRMRENDTSGDFLVKALEEAGHHTGNRTIVRDDIYQIRAVLSALIAHDWRHRVFGEGLYPRGSATAL